VRRVFAVCALLAMSCAHKQPAVKRGPPLVVAAIPKKRARLGAITWPTAKSAIYCTRRVDDEAQPVGVAGPCHRLEAGDPTPTKIISWATLGRFDTLLPDTTPASYGGRCHLEIEQGQRNPELRSARLIWVTPTKRVELDDWMPTDDAAAVEADGFTVEASFAPEGEWMAILHVAVGLGEGERVVQIAGAKLVKSPACE